MENSIRKISYLYGFMLLLLCTGCTSSKTFRVHTVHDSHGPKTVKSLSATHPYIIAHQGDSAWHLRNVQYNWKANSMTATVDTLPAERTTYKIADSKKSNRVIILNDGPFDEMHLNVFGLNPDSTGQVRLYKENIYKIQTYYGKGTGILLGILGIGLLIGWFALWFI